MNTTGTIKKKRVGILISGRGSNMQSLINAAEAPDYPAEIVLVVSNRPDAPGIAWAKQKGIATLGLDHTHYENRAHFESQLTSLLKSAKVELVALAGFMRLLTEDFVAEWHDKLINIHPSLLPAFKGLNTHQRALDAGVKIAGCTVHFVRLETDVGPIVGQAAVPVLPGDTADDLASRVLEAEHRLYPLALALVASGKARVVGETVALDIPVNQKVALLSPPAQ